MEPAAMQKTDRVDGSPDWLPPDEVQEASCGRTDAMFWAAALGLVVIVFVVAPLAESAMPWRAIGIVLGVISAIYLWRVVRVRVTVDADGVRIRGIATGRRLTWNDVVAVETTDGPSWMSFASWRAQSSRRLTQRSATSTVLRLRDGTTLRPLALTRSLPSRSAERVTRLAQRFTSRA
jgi:hypothetical protein